MTRPNAGFSSIRLLTAGILTACASNSMASGYALIEQSASQMGNAYAGGSAVAEDASTIYFNPAGLSRVPHQAIAAIHLIKPQAEFNGSATDIFGNPVSGGDGGDAGDLAGVPNLYYALPLNNDLVFGLGVNAPFALSTKYDDDWTGRYHAINSEVTTVNINPSLAFQVNQDFSIGVGISVQYIEAELTQKIDQGSLCVPTYISLGQTPADAAAICAGTAPQGNDGFGKVRGDDWSTGFNLGFLFQATDSTRIGFAYRSKVEHQLQGTANFRSTIPQFSGIGLFTHSDIEANVDLPATMSLSLFHDINRRWALMADATWTGWSSFRELRIEYDNPVQPDSVTDESWNNSMRYALGVNYRPNDNWLFRAGTAYDETPIPKKERRTPRIPGDDRIWASIGVGYQLSQAFTIDVGYAHLFIDDPEMDHSASRAGDIKGDYDASVDILSLQVVWNI